MPFASFRRDPMIQLSEQNIMFKNLHKRFETNETDLHELQQEEGFSRYILVRSLTNNDLKALIKTVNDNGAANEKAELLYEEVFISEISNDKIIEYIHKQYPTEKKKRTDQEVHLPNIIENFGDVKCGVRNDNLNDTAKDLVRDKTIKTKEDLEKKVDELLNGTIRGYILWQYYNQVTNDLIEHIFNDHENIIPTLRKIKYVDFMIKVGDKIIPFDLKITHISDDYFDLYKRGLSRVADGDDDYVVGDNKSEMAIIKEYYKGVKKSLDLPNYSGLCKTELVDILRNTGDHNAISFVSTLEKDRAKMVTAISQNLRSVEWWNYKYQGERLFKNNNRFFVFLAYKSSFADARPLKGKLQEISQAVKARLDTIKEDNLNEINYYYSKDKGLEGHYVVNSTSVMLTN